MAKYKSSMRDLLNYFKKDYFTKLNANKTSPKIADTFGKEDLPEDSTKTFVTDHKIYSRLSEVDELKRHRYLEMMPVAAIPEKKRDSKSIEKEVDKGLKDKVKKGEVIEAKHKKVSVITPKEFLVMKKMAEDKRKEYATKKGLQEFNK